MSDRAVNVTGKVREVASSVDPAAGTVRVKIGTERPPPAMTLGAVITRTGRLKQRKRIILPWSTLASQDGKPAVWVVDPHGRAVALRRVTSMPIRPAKSFCVPTGTGSPSSSVVPRHRWPMPALRRCGVRRQCRGVDAAIPLIGERHEASAQNSQSKSTVEERRVLQHNQPQRSGHEQALSNTVWGHGLAITAVNLIVGRAGRCRDQLHGPIGNRYGDDEALHSAIRNRADARRSSDCMSDM